MPNTRRTQRLMVPKNAHPLIRDFYEIMRVQNIVCREVAEQAGLGETTVHNWRTMAPQLYNFIAALNVLGYDLELVDQRTRQKYKPPPTELPPGLTKQITTQERNLNGQRAHNQHHRKGLEAWD